MAEKTAMFNTIDDNGITRWYLRGSCKDPLIDEFQPEYLFRRLHKKDGPAIHSDDGVSLWYLFGKRHREDGPAVIMKDTTQWFIQGEEFSEEEYNDKMGIAKQSMTKAAR
jgi:hypothetical protein